MKDEFHAISCSCSSFYRIKRHDQFVELIISQIASHRDPHNISRQNGNLKPTVDNENKRADIDFRYKNATWAIDVQFSKGLEKEYFQAKL